MQEAQTHVATQNTFIRGVLNAFIYLGHTTTPICAAYVCLGTSLFCTTKCST